MAFFATILTTLIKAVFVGAVAFCGILLGKNLRQRKDAKVMKQEADSVDAK